jgi:hypothetical protein
METRRLTVVVTIPQVEALRRLLRPGEGMNELLKRLIEKETHTQQEGYEG